MSLIRLECLSALRCRLHRILRLDSALFTGADTNSNIRTGQLTFFGRSLTENRLLSSANYVRTELPTRLAHRLRDMQTLPFVVVTNPHMSHVYDLYYKAFEKLRRIREIKTAEDNEKYCRVVSETLQEHLTVIPRLAMGVLECQDLMRPEQIDKLVNTLLRSVRYIIYESHL